MYIKWWIANSTYYNHNGQFDDKTSSQQSHSCSLLDMFWSHEEHPWYKEQVQSGMSDQTNIQKASLLTQIQQQKGSVDFPNGVGRVGRGALIYSGRLDHQHQRIGGDCWRSMVFQLCTRPVGQPWDSTWC